MLDKEPSTVNALQAKHCLALIEYIKALKHIFIDPEGEYCACLGYII